MTEKEAYKLVDRINKKILRMNEQGLTHTKEYRKLTKETSGLSYHYNKEGIIQFDKGKEALKKYTENARTASKFRTRDKVDTAEVRKRVDKDIVDYAGMKKEFKQKKGETEEEFKSRITRSKKFKEQITPAKRAEYSGRFEKLHDYIVNNTDKYYGNPKLKLAVHRKGQLTEEEAEELIKAIEDYSPVTLTTNEKGEKVFTANNANALQLPFK